MVKMDEVSEAVNDLEMIGGELAYLVSDLPAHIEGHNWKRGHRNRILSIVRAADAARLRLVALREALQLPARPHFS